MMFSHSLPGPVVLLVSGSTVVGVVEEKVVLSVKKNHPGENQGWSTSHT
jgi:hypothetical protein